MGASRRSKTAVVCLVFLATWLAPTAATSASSKASEGVTFRAVLCFAANPSKPAFSKAAALPVCQLPYQLTSKNLSVDPDNSPAGFKVRPVSPDPRFRRFQDSSSAAKSLTSNLLLSGITGSQSKRFMLGPARLTSSAIKSAKAVRLSLGQWVVTYQLTKAGGVAWNAFAKRQFHEFIAIVANGEVYSAPLIEPTHTHFTSFADSGEVSGAFTRAQAAYLAQQMHPSRS
jgi:preprotein translocase subunit SecD